MPSSDAAFAAPPERCTSGGPPPTRLTITSEKATPAPNPVPSAFKTASFAANLPAKRSTRACPSPTSSISSWTKQRGISGSRGLSIQRCIADISTRSIPCPTMFIFDPFAAFLVWTLALLRFYAALEMKQRTAQFHAQESASAHSIDKVFTLVFNQSNAKKSILIQQPDREFLSRQLPLDIQETRTHRE